MSFSERLKNTRKRRGLTQAQLAKDSGLAIGTIQQYELNKRTPRPDALAKIANALNVGYSYTKEGEPYFYNFVDTVHNENNLENEKFNMSQYTDLFSDASSLSKEMDKQQKMKQISDDVNKNMLHTIAAHFDGNEYTEEELEEIRQFAEFVKSKRNK